MQARNLHSYHTWMTEEQDQALQEVALELAAKQELWDSRRKRFVIANGKRVAPYAIAKFALLELLRNHGYSHDLVRPDAQLRAEKRRRTVL